MGAWKGIVRKTNGELVSVGTVVADTIPATLEVVDLGDVEPTFATHRWDAGTRTMVSRVFRDRMEDMIADPDFPSLTVAQRTALRAMVRKYFPDAMRQYDG